MTCSCNSLITCGASGTYSYIGGAFSLAVLPPWIVHIELAVGRLRHRVKHMLNRAAA